MNIFRRNTEQVLIGKGFITKKSRTRNKEIHNFRRNTEQVLKDIVFSDPIISDVF